MALSTQQLAALKTELAKPAYSAMTDAQRFAAVNAPGFVPNPTPAPDIPQPLTVLGLMSLLDGDARARIYNRPGVVQFGQDVARGDRAAVANWLYLARDAGDVTADQYAALMGVVQGTGPDPGWPATVPGPSVKQTLFGAATWQQADGSTVDYIPLADIAAAR